MTHPLACQFIRSVLMENFKKDYQFFFGMGTLNYELSNIYELCAPILIGLEANDRFLKDEVISTIAMYLAEV